jgi:hypothetical protein
LNEVHHTTERFLFEDLQGKKLEVDFDGGEVRCDAEKRRPTTIYMQTSSDTRTIFARMPARWSFFMAQPCSAINELIRLESLKKTLDIYV